jgi:hypothetical protein
MPARKNPTRFQRLPAALLLAAVFLFVVADAMTRQRVRSNQDPSDSQNSNSNSNRDSQNAELGSRENEMRAKLILKEEKKRYDEHLSRAREAAQLASQLVETYRSKQQFNSEDDKKLERLEKLAKRVRNEAGGSDTEAEAKDAPADTPSAVKQMAEIAEDLRKLVEKTPRHVISASVIDEANKLIGLIQFVRSSGR